jgi:hypothetical protein
VLLISALEIKAASVVGVIDLTRLPMQQLSTRKPDLLFILNVGVFLFSTGPREGT